MLVGPWLGIALYSVLGVVRPLFGATRALANKDEGSAQRWLTFFLVAFPLALPLKWLPWCPFRYELLIAIAATFGACDARVASAVYFRYCHLRVANWMLPVEEVARNVSTFREEDVLVSIEAAAGRALAFMKYAKRNAAIRMSSVRENVPPDQALESDAAVAGSPEPNSEGASSADEAASEWDSPSNPEGASDE